MIILYIHTSKFLCTIKYNCLCSTCTLPQTHDNWTRTKKQQREDKYNHKSQKLDLRFVGMTAPTYKAAQTSPKVTTILAKHFPYQTVPPRLLLHPKETIEIYLKKFQIFIPTLSIFLAIIVRKPTKFYLIQTQLWWVLVLAYLYLFAHVFNG